MYLHPKELQSLLFEFLIPYKGRYIHPTQSKKKRHEAKERNHSRVRISEELDPRSSSVSSCALTSDSEHESPPEVVFGFRPNIVSSEVDVLPISRSFSGLGSAFAVMFLSVKSAEGLVSVAGDSDTVPSRVEGGGVGNTCEGRGEGV